jgi:hypothetical protein
MSIHSVRACVYRPALHKCTCRIGSEGMNWTGPGAAGTAPYAQLHCMHVCSVQRVTTDRQGQLCWLDEEATMDSSCQQNRSRWPVASLSARAAQGLLVLVLLKKRMRCDYESVQVLPTHHLSPACFGANLFFSNQLAACLPALTNPTCPGSENARLCRDADADAVQLSFFYLLPFPPFGRSIDAQETSASKAKQCFSSSLAVARCDHTFMIRKILR